MPEKFTFSMLIATAPSIPLRQSLLHELPRRVSRWLKDPVEVLFLDPTDAASAPTVPWHDPPEAPDRHLAQRTMAFVYFKTEEKNGGQSIVELSESAHATIYSLTLPDAGYNIGSSAILKLMIELRRWLASNEMSTFIIGGNELSAGQDWTTEEDGVGRALAEPLVEWLCCAQSRISPPLSEFEVVRKLDDVAICRRTARERVMAGRQAPDTSRKFDLSPHSRSPDLRSSTLLQRDPLLADAPSA